MNKVLSNKAGNVILELRQETMSAWLTIKQSGKLIDENDILALIQEAGIKTGFNKALTYIREQGLEKEYDVPFPIAICNRTESTTTLRYRFNPDIQPDPENGLGYSTLQELSFVKAGEVVAEYSNNLFEQGGSIYDIFGELIDPGDVDLELAGTLAGTNIRFNAADKDYVADKSGYPYLDSEGRICLLDVVLLKTEDIPVGQHLLLQTDTVLEGNLAHAEITCWGNLQVKGELQSCSVLCHKDLFLEGEINGCQTEGVHVLGDLSCQGIINSKVLCKGQLRFGGVISDSNTICQGEIIGDPENSTISGGLTQSGASISISNAGSPDGKKTEIEIAIMPYQRSVLMQMTKELVKLKEDTETNSLAIHDLDFKIQKCETELDDQLNQFLQRPAEDRKSIRVSGVDPPLFYTES